ncbi:MAG: D-aminoacyl-tRNA deacylase [Actinobacteria bacterium]|nr:D-aminoacyl-tRNA deacylase [Actinomycetota bacterium]
MRALVQRVTRASVLIPGPPDREIAAIGPGLLVLLGVTQGDDAAAAHALHPDLGDLVGQEHLDVGRGDPPRRFDVHRRSRGLP